MGERVPVPVPFGGALRLATDPKIHNNILNVIQADLLTHGFSFVVSPFSSFVLLLLLFFLFAGRSAFTYPIFINNKTMTAATHYSCMATTVTSNPNRARCHTIRWHTNRKLSICTINIFLIKEIDRSCGVCSLFVSAQRQLLV